MILGNSHQGWMVVTALWLSLPLGRPYVYGQVKLESSERVVQESRIREAVIRFQMEEWSRNMDSYAARAREPWEKETAKELNYKVYFIRISGKDPSDEFVKSFSDIPRLVRKASKAQYRVSGSAGVMDRETHQTGIIFTADTIRWLKDDSVEVDGGYYCGGLCASAKTFAVHLEQGRWIAKLLRVNGVS